MHRFWLASGPSDRSETIFLLADVQATVVSVFLSGEQASICRWRADMPDTSAPIPRPLKPPSTLHDTFFISNSLPASDSTVMLRTGLASAAGFALGAGG